MQHSRLPLRPSATLQLNTCLVACADKPRFSLQMLPIVPTARASQLCGLCVPLHERSSSIYRLKCSELISHVSRRKWCLSSVLSATCRAFENEFIEAQEPATRCLAKATSSSPAGTETAEIPQYVGPKLVAIGVALFLMGYADPTSAFEIRTEPANALSLPTWAVHVSSVLEWVTAMVLFWRLAEASGAAIFAALPCAQLLFKDQTPSPSYDFL